MCSGNPSSAGHAVDKEGESKVVIQILIYVAAMQGPFKLVRQRWLRVPRVDRPVYLLFES